MNVNQENIIKQLQLENEEVHNLIPIKDVDLIKIKLGKSHRKESDWEIIKDILSSHNVIVAEPEEKDSRVKIVEHIICEEDRYLFVFTNFKDCGEYIKGLNKKMDHQRSSFVWDPCHLMKRLIFQRNIIWICLLMMWVFQIRCAWLIFREKRK